MKCDRYPSHFIFVSWILWKSANVWKMGGGCMKEKSLEILDVKSVSGGR